MQSSPEMGKPVDAIFTLSICSTTGHWCLCEWRLCTYIWRPSCCGCCPEDTSLDSLALMTSRTHVHRGNGMVANKKFLTGNQPPRPRAWCRGNRRKSPSPSVPPKEYLHTLNAAAQGSSFRSTCIYQGA